MSKFYGTVPGQASTAATRRGSQDIKVTAQSWDGSVIVRLHYNDEGVLMVEVSTDDSSSAYRQSVFEGTFDEFKARLSGEEEQA